MLFMLTRAETSCSRRRRRAADSSNLQEQQSSSFSYHSNNGNKSSRQHPERHPGKRQLLLGLCISDLFLSASYACSTFLSPAVDNPREPLETTYRGTNLTCIIQAASSQLGLAQPCYNAALCMYFVLCVKFHKTDRDFLASSPTGRKSWFLPI